jgi:hypothetical protein
MLKASFKNVERFKKRAAMIAREVFNALCVEDAKDLLRAEVRIVRELSNRFRYAQFPANGHFIAVLQCLRAFVVRYQHTPPHRDRLRLIPGERICLENVLCCTCSAVWLIDDESMERDDGAIRIEIGSLWRGSVCRPRDGSESKSDAEGCGCTERPPAVDDPDDSEDSNDSKE